MTDAITSGLIGAVIAIALTILAQQFAQRAQHRQWLRDRRSKALESLYSALQSAAEEVRGLVRDEFWGEQAPRRGGESLYTHRRQLRDLSSRLDLFVSEKVQRAAQAALDRFDWCVASYTGDRLFNNRPTVARVDKEGQFVGGSQSMIFDTSTEAVDQARDTFVEAISEFRRLARKHLKSNRAG